MTDATEPTGTKPRARFMSDGQVLAVNDGLTNFMTGMGTDLDKRSHAFFTYDLYSIYNYAELEAAYATNWLAREIIDIPVNDCTKEWRAFEGDHAKAIQQEEKRLKLQQVIQEAFKQAGIYGGGVILMITDQDLTEPLDINKLKKGSLKRLIALDRHQVSGMEYNLTDPTDEYFLKPRKYMVNGAAVVDASHCVPIPGEWLPYRLRQLNGGWGESKLRKCLEDLKDTVGAKSGVVQLILEANVDTIKRDGLADDLSTDFGTNKLVSRYQKANLIKSISRMLLLDGTETYERKAAQFSGLGELLARLMEWTSGAARIPMTRLFGVQSKGLGDSGEGDMQTYYGNCQGEQESEYRPVLEKIDRVMLRSLLGEDSNAIEFEFNPLSLPSANEVAQQRLANAQADDIRIQQGVPFSLVLQNLAAEGEYAITPAMIDEARDLENIKLEPGGPRDPDMPSLLPTGGR